MNELKNEIKDQLNISQLTDEELKKKIININDRQLAIIRDMSYYYFIRKSGELIQQVNEDELFYKINSQEKERLIKNLDIIIELFKKLHKDIVDEDVEVMNVLLNTRKDLYELSEAILGYEIELSYIKEILDHNSMKLLGKAQYKERSLKKEDINLLINKIGNRLDNSTVNDNVYITIVSNILSIIPFRMSKYKYFDVVKSTIIRNFEYYPEDIVESKLEEYKILFDSTLTGNYGIVFDNYFTSIKKLKNMDLEYKSLEELKDIGAKILDLTKEINKLALFINELGILINRLIILYMDKHKIDLKLHTRDMYEGWEEYMQNPNKGLIEVLSRACEKEFKKAEKELLKDVEYFETLNMEGVKRQGFFDDSLNQEILYTGKILTYFNDMKFSKLEVLFPKENGKIDFAYLERLVDNLVQYINRSISSMDKLERKLRMRRLFSALELPFGNIKEFLSYIQYSLDEKVASIDEILFTIDTINYWLDQFEER